MQNREKAGKAFGFETISPPSERSMCYTGTVLAQNDRQILYSSVCTLNNQTKPNQRFNQNLKTVAIWDVL